MRALMISVSRELIHVMAPPLGEAYIASYLLSQGHQVKILDLTNSNDSRNDISRAIENFSPHVIGITLRNIDSTTYPGNLFFYLPARNVIQYIKEIAEPEIPIILGGAGFSIFSEEILKDLNHNYGVIGDGEYVFAEILKKIENGEDIRKLEKGICYLDSKGNYHEKPPWRVNNLDDLPNPARELIDNKAYLINPLDKNGEVWGNIQTKRGCPKHCIYCSYRYIEGSNVRYRSQKKVVEEIDSLINNYGIKNVFFVDSVFNLNREYIKSLCQEIVKKDLDLNWGANYVPDKNFLDIMPLMKQSGAIHLATGMESLSNEMLQYMQKDRLSEDAILTSEKCFELEIEQLIHMIVGGPQETLETVRTSLDSLQTIESYKARAWQGDGDVLLFIGLRIYPHTQLQLLAEQEGIIQENQNLLRPKFYISPNIKEPELFKVIREYCSINTRWMAPGLGINNPDGFAELSNIQFAKYQT